MTHLLCPCGPLTLLPTTGLEHFDRGQNGRIPKLNIHRHVVTQYSMDGASTPRPTN